MDREKIQPLLLDIVRDNPTFPFPHNSISKELTALFFGQEYFEDHIINIHNKLTKEFGGIVPRVFIGVVDRMLNFESRKIHHMTKDEYFGSIEEVITVLQGLRITRVEKKTSDGELISQITLHNID